MSIVYLCATTVLAVLNLLSVLFYMLSFPLWLLRLEPVSLAVLYMGLSPRTGMEGKNDMCMIVIVPKETGGTLP